MYLSDTKRLKNLAHFILKPGIISIFFLNILSIAYLATYELFNGFTEKCTPAALLKFVSTGPGHKTET